MSKTQKRNNRIAKRQHKLPMDYLEAVSDRIHQTSPTQDIITNTLAGVYSTAYAKGYARCLADDKGFRDKVNTHLKADWNACKDKIDDLIHENSNQKQK